MGHAIPRDSLGGGRHICVEQSRCRFNPYTHTRTWPDTLDQQNNPEYLTHELTRA